MAKFDNSDSAYNAWLNEQRNEGRVWDGVLTAPIVRSGEQASKFAA